MCRVSLSGQGRRRERGRGGVSLYHACLAGSGGTLNGNQASPDQHDSTPTRSEAWLNTVHAQDSIAAAAALPQLWGVTGTQHGAD